MGPNTNKATTPMTSASGAPTPNREAQITLLRLDLLLPTFRKVKSAAFPQEHKRKKNLNLIGRKKAPRTGYSESNPFQGRVPKSSSYRRTTRPSAPARNPSQRCSSREESGDGRAGGTGGGGHRRWRRRGPPGGGGSPSAPFDWVHCSHFTGWG